MQLIIFKNDNGGVSIINPTAEALEAYSIEAIAQKDVPAGKPYKIIDSSELPDRELRNQWTVDEADLTDGVGSESNEFPKIEQDEQNDPN